MNSAQRRKFRRRWCHRIGYRDISERFDSSRFRDMVDWCNRTYGAKNWQLSTEDSHYFLFDKQEKAVMFVLRWS